jgi:hypothetical protein
MPRPAAIVSWLVAGLLKKLLSISGSIIDKNSCIVSFGK